MLSETSVIIDEMTVADLPQVIRIEKLSFPDPWPFAAFLADVESEETISLVARIASTVVGYAVCMVVLEEMHLANIAIHPDFRAKKIGHLLMERLFYIGEKQGCGIMYLDVRRSNTKAISFYKKYGFSVLYERRNYYRNPPEDALVMVLDLKERKQSGVV